MSSETLLLIIIGAWIAIGLAVPFVMARRGHDAFRWLMVSMVLGPLAILMATDSARYGESLDPVVVTKGDDHDGLAILVGYDGSRHAQKAVERAEVFGDRVGRLTIARVVPFAPSREDLARADADFRVARESFPTMLGVAPTFETLEGQPAAALAELARRDGYDLVIIGRHGTGLTNRLLGSTADRLAHMTDVSVLLVGDTSPSPRDAEHQAGDRDTARVL